MKIQKYVKDKQNKYKVYIDNEEYILYDDVIVKYELIMKKEISENDFKEMIKFNEEMTSYYDSIKYITKKLRSEKEIKEYLQKKGISESTINKTIKRLKETNFLNKEIYLKAYISDQLNFTNNGPKKIKQNLIKLGFDDEEVDEYINNIEESFWIEKIDKYINKKIKTNHNSSSSMLKIKITNDLVNLGYDKEQVTPLINKYDIIDEDILKREYEKAKKTLSKKYSGYELNQKIKEKLYRKGFKISDFKDVDYED